MSQPRETSTRPSARRGNSPTVDSQRADSKRWSQRLKVSRKNALERSDAEAEQRRSAWQAELTQAVRNPWLWLFFGALALRLAAVVLLHGPTSAPVSYEHGAIARNLLAGEGFSIRFLGVDGPTSQQAPFYPLALAALYGLFGTESIAHWVMQALQCVAGSVLVLQTARLTQALLPQHPGVVWTAALGGALFPPHIYVSTHLQVAVWAALVLTWLAATAVDSSRRPGWNVAVQLGLGAGALLLIDPILALALPWIWLAYVARVARQAEPSRRPWGTALAVPLLALLTVTPWLVRNYNVHNEFVFIKSSFGYAFWQGNNPHSWGTDKIPKPSARVLAAAHDGSLAGQQQALWEARHETLYIDDVLLKPYGYDQFAGLNEPARSRLLLDESLQFIRDQPARYLSLCGQRLRYFLLFDETNPKAWHPVYRASSLVWLVLMVVGGLASLPEARRLWPLYGLFLTLTLFHALTITSARFRIPLEPITFVWASLALGPPASRLFHSLHSSRRPLSSSPPSPPSASASESPRRAA